MTTGGGPSWRVPAGGFTTGVSKKGGSELEGSQMGGSQLGGFIAGKVTDGGSQVGGSQPGGGHVEEGRVCARTAGDHVLSPTAKSQRLLGCPCSFFFPFISFFTSIYPGLLFLFSFLLPVCVASFSTSLVQC